ncbi:MAG: hypothetical protein M3360_00750 [Actinomycetota bacterium]|nr:hypothetical protein [Actinomycetota bacterium]
MKAHGGPTTAVQRPRYHTPTVHSGVPLRVSIPEGYIETDMGRDTLFRRFGWLPELQIETLAARSELFHQHTIEKPTNEDEDS